MIKIWTDGGLRTRQGSRRGIGAWAAVIETGDTRIEIDGGESNVTANMMEVKAVVRSLEQTASVEDDTVVYTDSEYVIGMATKNQPRTLNKSRYVSRMRNLYQQRPVFFKKISGHSGEPNNEWCHARVSEILNNGEFRRRVRIHTNRKPISVNDGKTDRCRFCRQEVIWGVTDEGRPAAADTEPVDGVYYSHFETCLNVR